MALAPACHQAGCIVGLGSEKAFISSIPKRDREPPEQSVRPLPTFPGKPIFSETFASKGLCGAARTLPQHGGLQQTLMKTFCDLSGLVCLIQWELQPVLIYSLMKYLFPIRV